MKSIAVIVLILSSLHLTAQEKTGGMKRNGISLTAGHVQVKDENIHPKVFRGITFGVSYEHSGNARNISEYDAGLRLSAMNTSLEDFPSAAGISIHGGYKYLFNIIRGHDIGYYLGPLAQMQYGTNAFFNWDESHLHFANFISAGVGNRITFSKRNKLFSFNVDLPLLSCIFRPEYNPQHKIDDMTAGGIFSNLASNPEAALPGKNFWLGTGLEMSYQSPKGRNRALEYNLLFHHMQASGGKQYRNIENSISYKFNF